MLFFPIIIIIIHIFFLMMSLFLPKPKCICIVYEPCGQEVPITLKTQVTCYRREGNMATKGQVAYAF
jgi:hypothetical protein